MGGAVCVRAERRGEGRKDEEGGGEGGKKNAPLKAEWKLTPAPKWLRVRPPPPPAAPPPGHVLPSFLKGGLGISVGVVGPAAAPSPSSSATRPPPPPSARRRWRGCGDISPQRHTRHPALGAGIAPAPHTAQPTPPPVISFFPPPASARGAHVHWLSPRRAPGHRPRSAPPAQRAAAQTPAPRRGTCARVGLAETTAPAPVFPRPRRPPSPPASGRGGARAGSGSLREGAPRGGLPEPGLGSPAVEGLAAGEPPGAGNGTGRLTPRDNQVRSPSPEAGVFNKPRRSDPFPLCLIQRKGDR